MEGKKARGGRRKEEEEKEGEKGEGRSKREGRDEAVSQSG